MVDSGAQEKNALKYSLQLVLENDMKVQVCDNLNPKRSRLSQADLGLSLLIPSVGPTVKTRTQE